MFVSIGHFFSWCWVIFVCFLTGYQTLWISHPAVLDFTLLCKVFSVCPFGRGLGGWVPMSRLGRSQEERLQSSAQRVSTRRGRAGVMPACETLLALCVEGPASGHCRPTERPCAGEGDCHSFLWPLRKQGLPLVCSEELRLRITHCCR